MPCMIFLSSFHVDDDFIEDNEEFKLGDGDIEKLNNFSKILKF